MTCAFVSLITSATYTNTPFARNDNKTVQRSRQWPPSRLIVLFSSPSPSLFTLIFDFADKWVFTRQSRRRNRSGTSSLHLPSSCFKVSFPSFYSLLLDFAPITERLSPVAPHSPSAPLELFTHWFTLFSSFPVSFPPWNWIVCRNVGLLAGFQTDVLPSIIKINRAQVSPSRVICHVF